MFCSHCGKSDQPADTYCKVCGKFLHNNTRFGGNESPPNVVAGMVIFSFVSFIVGMLATRCLFLPWRESKIMFVFLMIAAATAQICTIWWGIRLRKRLTQSRRKFPDELGQKTIEDGASMFIETNIASVVEHATKKLEPVLRDKPLRSIGSRGRQTG
jgi:hypothetical protein